MKSRTFFLFLGMGTVAFLGLSLEVRAQGQSREQILQKLYPAAKKEGEVVFNSGGGDLDLGGKEGIAKFMKRFPGIKVTASSIPSSTLVPRLIAEGRAGSLTVDVYTDGPAAVIEMMHRGLVTTLDSRDLTDRPEGKFNPQSLPIANHSTTHFAYNTRLVPKADLPRRYEDLLDPRWKGKLALEARGGHAFTHLRLVWGEKRFWQFVRALPAQEPIWVLRSVEGTKRVASGEAYVGITTSFPKVQAMKAQGMPIEFLPLNPVFLRAKVFVPLKGAPHPNTTKLLIAWLLSPEGIEAVDKAGAGLAIPGTSLYKGLIAAGAELFYDEKLALDQMLLLENTMVEIGRMWGVVK